MAERKKYPYQNKMVEGEELTFKTEGEQFNIYTLSDGSKMKVKLVMLDVVRLVDEYDPNGNPIYLFTGQQVIGIDANPQLMRKVV